MKISISYNSEMIKELIIKDIESKVNSSIDENEIKILVRSRQNYRDDQFEIGELKCDLNIEI